MFRSLIVVLLSTTTLLAQDEEPRPFQKADDKTDVFKTGCAFDGALITGGRPVPILWTVTKRDGASFAARGCVALSKREGIPLKFALTGRTNATEVTADVVWEDGSKESLKAEWDDGRLRGKWPSSTESIRAFALEPQFKTQDSLRSGTGPGINALEPEREDVSRVLKAKLSDGYGFYQWAGELWSADAKFEVYMSVAELPNESLRMYVSSGQSRIMLRLDKIGGKGMYIFSSRPLKNQESGGGDKLAPALGEGVFELWLASEMVVGYWRLKDGTQLGRFRMSNRANRQGALPPRELTDKEEFALRTAVKAAKPARSGSGANGAEAEKVVTLIESELSKGNPVGHLVRDLASPHLKAWESAASRGDGNAAYLVGRCASLGLYLGKRTATEWYKQAAQKGCDLAELALADEYMAAAYGPPDESGRTALSFLHGVALLRELCDKNNSLAMVELARWADPPGNTRWSATFAENLLRKTHAPGSDDRGSAAALNALAMRTDHSSDTCRAWLALAVKGGSDAALFNMGNVLAERSRPNEAKEWYTLAGERGNPAAWYNLGLLHLESNETEVKPPYARDCFQKAADLGIDAAVRQLGVCYRDGIGGRMDDGDKRAAECFQKAAERGDMTALCCLVVMYEDGKLASLDAAAAGRRFAAASKAGDPAGEFGLGLLVEYGTGQPRNKAAAQAHYRSAAAGGYNAAVAKVERGARPPSNLPLTRTGVLRNRYQAEVEAWSAADLATRDYLDHILRQSPFAK